MKTKDQLDIDMEKIFAEAELEASVATGHQALLGLDRDEWRTKDFSVENPEEAHNLYFKAINKLLSHYVYPILVKGKARYELLEVKNLLLNYGKKRNSRGIRGSSGQMSLNATKQMVLDIIQEWVISDGLSTFNLYEQLRNKNIELGYLSAQDK